MACPNVNSNNRPIGVSYDSKNRAVGFLELSSIEVESISATNVSAASFTPSQFPFIFNGTISAVSYLGAGTGGNFLDLGDVTASTIQPNQLVFGSIEYPGTLELSSASSVILYNGFILASQVASNYATIESVNLLEESLTELEGEVASLALLIPSSINNLSDVQTSANAQGNLLTWSSSINKWINTPSSIFSIGGGPGVSSLSALNDVVVDIPELNIGNILSWDGTYWINTASSVFVTTPTIYFSSLLDTPANYTGASSNFVIVNPSATGLIFSSASFASSTHTHSYSLTSLTDISLTDIALGDLLRFNGSQWTNVASSIFLPSNANLGASSFLGLADTPANYTGASSNFVIVNSVGNALQFSSASFASSNHNHALSSLVDTLISGVSLGNILTWNGVNWVNTPSSVLTPSGGGSGISEEFATINYLNASGDSASASFYLQTLSSTTLSSTNISAVNIFTDNLIINTLELSANSISAATYQNITLNNTLEDVSISSISAGDVIVWNGSEWVNSASSIFSSSGGSTTFVGLTDTPEVYTGASSNFVIVNPSATGLIFSSASFASSTHTHSYSIDDISDVFIDDTQLEIGGLLMWNGVEWINIKTDVGSNVVLGWDTIGEKWTGRTISYGVAGPSGGVDGDIYLQYEE
jgi:hypothetical protein